MIQEHTLPNGKRIRVEHTDKKHDYWLEVVEDKGNDGVGAQWVKVPSVTTILDVYHKPALVWWGMQVGVRGCLELIQREGVRETVSELEYAVPVTDWDEDSVMAALTAHKLTVNHVKGQAADRGTDVHDAADNWAQGVDFEPTTPYHEALRDFLAFYHPTFEQTEMVMGSWADQYAGKCDALAYIGDEPWLLDYKTSKRVYETHYAQLAFYKLAGYESGYWDSATNRKLRQGIVLLTADGKYKLVENLHVGPHDARRLLDGYKGFKALRKGK